MMEKTAISFVTIDINNQSQRIDNYLLSKFKKVPKSVIYRIVRKGEVRVNKKRIKPSYKLISGDIVRIPPIKLDQSVGLPDPPESIQQQIEQTILFEDEHLLCLNKPAGIAVHKGSQIPYGIIDILKCLRPYARCLHLVHRIDKDTSGCLLVAKEREILVDLQQMFRDGEIDKQYLALVHGQWPKDKRKIVAPLLKVHRSSGQAKMNVRQDGKEAITEYEVKKSYKSTTLLSAKPITGRTHQIRVHCAESGFPICGDDRYGKRNLDIKLPKRPPRLFLHAQQMSFFIARMGRRYTFDAPLSKDLKRFIDLFEKA